MLFYQSVDCPIAKNYFSLQEFNKIVHYKLECFSEFILGNVSGVWKGASHGEFNEKVVEN